jgi:nicotinamide phosphoribosyltransferase
MKASAACVDGQWREVFKDPITDQGKTSLKGRVTLWQSGGDFLTSVEQPLGWTDRSMGEWQEALVEVYRDGKLIKEYTFDEIRANSMK